MSYLTTTMGLTVLIAINIEDNPHVPYSIQQVSDSGRFDQLMQDAPHVSGVSQCL